MWRCSSGAAPGSSNAVSSDRLKREVLGHGQAQPAQHVRMEPVLEEQPVDVGAVDEPVIRTHTHHFPVNAGN